MNLSLIEISCKQCDQPGQHN